MRFRLVDRILSWEPRKRISGLKAVGYAECSLKESTGEDLRLPDSLLVESFFQLGNWLIALSSDFAAMGLIIRARRIEVMGVVRPGDLLRMSSTVERFREDSVMLSGVGYIGDRQVCMGAHCMAVLAPLSEYIDPDELRALYRQIYRPDSSEGTAAH